MKLKLDRKAVSYNISVVLMVALAISITGLAVGMMTKYWRAQSQIFQLDLTESRILVNKNTGHGKIALVLKNTGTTTARIWKISIQTDSEELIAFFNAPQVFLSDNTDGTFAPSSPKVMLEGGELIIVSGQSASLSFPNTGTWDANSYFTAGKQYLVLAYPSTGGHVVSLPLVAESFGG